MADTATRAADGGAASVQAAPKLQVHVACEPIEEIGDQETAADVPLIDVIAVGHYAKVEPQFAELALDIAISGPSQSNAGLFQERNALGILRDFTGRGIIQGELGVPFFLPDPRDSRRIIAVAGMGSVGCFGAPELAFLARQLLWALSRLGRKHLATVLIGSGTGDLDVEAAVASWMNGAALAIASVSGSPPVEHLTFVEQIPEKAEKIRSALLTFRTSPGIPTLELTVTPSEPIPIPSGLPGSSGRPVVPSKLSSQPVTRLWVERRGKKYLFGWFLDQASHLRDFTQLDLDTILSTNDKLAAKEEPDYQRKKAEYLFNLIVPQSIREGFATKDPIVIECDNRTAQLHWEMLVDPSLNRGLVPGYEFLGIHPTITRQFRNSFGVPPEPPPRLDHTLRILMVADTDANRPLPAAREEAETINLLFEKHEQSLRSSGLNQRVLVESLVGPDQATYDSVLEKLLNGPRYDILHFSGHCEFVEEDPATSGWLFSKGKKITAYELSRVDRVPGFVFSNGCSSGVIPRDGAAVARRAVPSFAEAFFKQGVKNFICTAWPVASDRARDFACRFYEVLLGANTDRRGCMYEAMSEARKSIWCVTPSGTRTWGAYQHYGNPWHRLP
jgi:hypothetical protein